METSKKELMENMKNTFKERVDRLKKLVDLNAPSYIICNEIVLVYLASFAIYPTIIGGILASKMREYELASCGICPKCQGPMRHELHTCFSCLEKETVQ